MLVIPFLICMLYEWDSFNLTSRIFFMNSILSSYKTYVFDPFSLSSYVLLSVLYVTQFSNMSSSNSSLLHYCMNCIKLHIVLSISSMSSIVITSPTIFFQKIIGKSNVKCVAVLIAIAMSTPKKWYNYVWYVDFALGCITNLSLPLPNLL